MLLVIMISEWNIKRNKTAREMVSDVTVLEEDCVLSGVTMERWLMFRLFSTKMYVPIYNLKVNTLYHTKKSKCL